MKKIVISMTSWKKRIQFVPRTLYMLKKQTLQPDEIIINLATDEFENGMNDLPDDLKMFLETDAHIKVNWVKENTKAFKKVIPTIKSHWTEDCWIISVDDDFYYDTTFIECLVNSAETHPGHYITPCIYGKQPHGFCMIYDPKWFKDELLWNIPKSYMDEIITSDEWTYANLLKNGITPYIDRSLQKHLRDLDRGDKLCFLYGNIPQMKKRRFLIKQLSGISLTADCFKKY